MNGWMRAWGMALVALAVWFLSATTYSPHHVADASAPATSFSAARAEAVLATILGPERPHPVGSLENAAVRARIIEEFAKLGVHAQTYRAFTCNPWRGLAYVACATVTNIVAEVIPGEGKAIVLLAHYDSVPAGPGASDDESGVATVLETVRALQAQGGKSLHPVLAVITDGEEGGLLGANAFLQNPSLKGRVGVVVNVEARGTKGPSLLFQTSPGDSKLIDLYAKNVPVLATSSLYAEIYKILPNDTDLTLFIRQGFPAFNFAFADNVRYYHSPFDRRSNLDPATLQMHGDNMLGVAGALERTDFAALKGDNDIYLSLFGIALPRLPESWAVPFAVLVLLGLVIAAWLVRGSEPIRARDVASGVGMPLLLLIGGGLFGWLLSVIAQLVSGHPDPAYAYPVAMRFALGLGVWTVTLLVSRLVRGPGASPWIWMAVFGVATAWFLPGLSPYFVFPALVAAVFLLVTTRTEGAWSGSWGQVAFFVSALAAFLIWIALVVSGETLMGLRLHPLFTIPLAFALMTSVPVLAGAPMSRRAWRASVALSAAAAIVFAIVAGLIPAYSKLSPQRVNIVYLESGHAPARFIADTSWKGVGTEPIPASLKAAGPFALNHEAWAGLLPGGGYTAPAGAARYPLPTATVLEDRSDGSTRQLEIAFSGSPDASGMLVAIPKEAKLISLDLRGQHMAAKDSSGNVRVICWTPDCRDLHLSLVLGNTGAVSISFAEVRYGLPVFGARLQAARPETAMASQSGDEVVLANKLDLAAK